MASESQSNDVKAKMKWLKNNQRAAWFYLFHLLKAMEKEGIPGASGNDTISSKKSLSSGLSEINHSDFILNNNNQYASIDMPISNTDFTNSDLSGKGKTEVVTSSNINDDLGQISGFDIDSFSGVSGLTSNENDFSFLTFNGEIIQGVPDVYDTIEHIFSLPGTNQINRMLNDVNSKWIRVYDAFPDPFSWVDINDEDQCLWVLRYMSKKLIQLPLKPKNNAQRWCFISAAFDLWNGWDEKQRKRLNAERGRAKPIPPEGILTPWVNTVMYKRFLLTEMEKAWKQKQFRKDNKSKKMTITLPRKSQEQLEYISERHSVAPLGMLKKLIKEAYENVSYLQDIDLDSTKH
ncbi:hypothetical protein [Kosakonia sacchari]|uniref:hypothetical protein n=1 Tax=Kosakonia sacchari TaxID=1158459 RepID=UPI003F56D282